jgi:phage shock protein C
MKKLTLSNNRQLAGVCAGIAEFFGWEPTKIRVLWFIATLISAGTLIVAYLICALVFPKPPAGFNLQDFRQQ